MKMILQRTWISGLGQFSELVDDHDTRIWHTAEHAYQDEHGTWAPKIPAGTYTCVLGTHALHDGVPFKAYEITGVTGHSGLLFHVGCFPQKDSDGCVLIGDSAGDIDGVPAVLNSRLGFASFMAFTNGAPTFELEVVDA